jgi:HK97 family phage prohead protease
MEKRTLYGKKLSARASDDANPQIVADFVVFSDVYDMGWGMRERVDPHAFDKCLTNDIRALLDHNTNIVLGRTSAGTLRLFVDEYGLHGVIDINPEDRQAMDLYARVKRGDVSQCSFGFEILDESFEDQSDGTVLVTIREVNLWEVSIVTFPAYKATSAKVRSAQAFRNWKERMKARIANEQK